MFTTRAPVKLFVCFLASVAPANPTQVEAQQTRQHWQRQEEVQVAGDAILAGARRCAPADRLQISTHIRTLVSACFILFVIHLHECIFILIITTIANRYTVLYDVITKLLVSRLVL